MKKTILLFIAIVFGALQCALAAPLKNIEVRLTQPDGQVVHCFASGDEFYNYLHDAQGFTIVKGESGFYCYAMHDGQGQVVPSPYRVGSVDPAEVGLHPYVKISEAEYHRRRHEREKHIQPVNRPKNRELNHGIYNNLVVFIRFAGDTYHNTPFSDVDSMFNACNYESVSLRNYYHHTSYNQLDLRSFFYPEPDGQTVLSYEDINPKQYYQPYDPTSNPIGYQDYERAEREFSLLERAINYVEGMVPDTLDLDYNEDGMVDNVVFVIKGETGEWNSLLWPHRWTIYDRYVPLNGLRVYDFNLQLEQGGYFNVSTLCHEMFHSLGAPDLYHYNGGIDPVGGWDLMCGNADPPQQTNIYMKYKYGNWVDAIPLINPQNPEACGTYELEANAWEGGRRNGYMISIGSSSQYFFVEYRNKNNIFESKLPGSGLLIYRIDARFDGNAGWNGYDQFDEVYLFRPGGTPDDEGKIKQAHFSQESGRTAFNIDTDPMPFLNQLYPYDDWSFEITNIGSTDDRMCFSFLPYGGEGGGPLIENFTAHVNSWEHRVELSWDRNPNADHYMVYCDSLCIAPNVTDTTFTLPYTEADNGYHTYSVLYVSEGTTPLHSAPSSTWVILGNYETLRLTLASDSPYGTKGGEIEVSFDHPLMPTQHFTIYEGNQREVELHVPAGTQATFRWNPGFDPDSEGIHIMAQHLNANSQGLLFDLDRPQSGIIATYTAANEGLGLIPPQHLTATSTGPAIQLRWTIPAENQDFAVYRDGALHQTINGGNTYLDSNIMRSSTHSYIVTSTCGEVSSCEPDPVYATAMGYYCEPPRNLQGSYFDNGHMELSWDAPEFVGHGMMAYDDNRFVEQIGASSYKWGIKIEPKNLAYFSGHPLTEIEIFDCATGTYTFTIYNGNIPNNSTTLFVQQRQMEATYQWVRFALDEAVSFDPTLPLWVCVSTSSVAQAPIPCCSFVGEDNSCLIKSGSMWKPVTQFEMNYSWMLRAYTSPIERRDFTYNLYWGPEDCGDEEMVMGQEALTATQATHNANDNLRLCVTAIWDGRETDFSNSIALGPTAGIETLNTKNQCVEIFPNPVNDQLTVKGKALRQVRLVSLTGTTLFECRAEGETLQIEMGNLPQGLYLLHIQHEDSVEVVKVMKR